MVAVFPGGVKLQRQIERSLRTLFRAFQILRTCRCLAEILCTSIVSYDSESRHLPDSQHLESSYAAVAWPVIDSADRFGHN